MRIVFWAKLQLARQQIIDSVQAVPGVQLQVTGSLAETLAALPGASGLVLVHGPQEEANHPCLPHPPSDPAPTDRPFHS